ncbi:hypothetical protein BDZ89DRAFT_47198 [Hymenopellis radicata]|nr:hypothetical protein BDZ89DRAFT_47198 [Hymenopellis radicata]
MVSTEHGNNGKFIPTATFPWRMYGSSGDALAVHQIGTKLVMGSGEQTADGWRATKFICRRDMVSKIMIYITTDQPYRFATTLWVLALPAQHLLLVFIIRTIFVAIIAGDRCQSFPDLGCPIRCSRQITKQSIKRQFRNNVEGGDLRAESS